MDRGDRELPGQSVEPCSPVLGVLEDRLGAVDLLDLLGEERQHELRRGMTVR
jgi:hypothetical protein